MKETLEFIKTMNKYIGAICQNNNETESEREQAIIEFANEAIQQVKDNIVLGGVSGSFITEKEMFKYPVKGKKFINEYGVVKEAEKFDYDDCGIPYLFWNGHKTINGMIPAINLRLNKKMKWL